MRVRERPLDRTVGEEYFAYQVETTELILVGIPLPRQRILVIAELLRKVEETNRVLVYGPEIDEAHWPDWPGDAPFIRAIAVCRPAV